MLCIHVCMFVWSFNFSHVEYDIWQYKRAHDQGSAPICLYFDPMERFNWNVVYSAVW